jgi:hypothetical protein
MCMPHYAVVHGKHAYCGAVHYTQCIMADYLIETNRIHFVTYVTRKRTSGPYLAAANRILSSHLACASSMCMPLYTKQICIVCTQKH